MAWDKRNKPPVPLPHNWLMLKKQRHLISGNRCEQIMSNGIRCPDPAEETDHIINRANGGTNHINNLQDLCHHHHKMKTARESAAARRANKKDVGEPHPSGMKLYRSKK